MCTALTWQHYLDRFTRMWNNHRIRGARTTAGHGGGIPAELYRDKVRISGVVSGVALGVVSPGWSHCSDLAHREKSLCVTKFFHLGCSAGVRYLPSLCACLFFLAAHENPSHLALVRPMTDPFVGAERNSHQR